MVTAATSTRSLDVLAEAVRHEVKRPIWRYEADGSIIVKPRQPYTLVEFDVLQVHCFLLVVTPLGLKQHLQQAIKRGE